MHPALDPEIEMWLGSPEGESVSMPLLIEEISRHRQMQAEQAPSDETLRAGGLVNVSEIRIPGPAGAPDLSLLVLRPTFVAGPRPCVYFVHPGGMVLGENRSCIDGPLGVADLVAELGVVAVSVDYRVAPEHPHPAPVEDCFAGLVWTASHADEIDVDRNRILIVGVSGGGGLAAATALMVRDRNGPKLTHQVLVCPMLDDRETTVSSKYEGIPWGRTSNQQAWSAVLGEKCGGTEVSSYAAPARELDLAGLPPTYLDAGGAEVFRDEIIAYGARLAAAGVSVELHIWGGAVHSSEIFVPDAEVSRAATAARRSYFKRALSH